MANILIIIVSALARVLMLIVIVQAVLSFFMSPYHPIRVAIDRIVDPMLYPIRKVIPNVGMFDFSPIILILLIQLIEFIILQLLQGLR